MVHSWEQKPMTWSNEDICTQNVAQVVQIFKKDGLIWQIYMSFQKFYAKLQLFLHVLCPPHIWKFSKKSRKFVNQDVPKLPRCEEDANEGCHLTFLSTPSIGNNLVQLTRIIEGDASQNNQKTYFFLNFFVTFEIMFQHCSILPFKLMVKYLCENLNLNLDWFGKETQGHMQSAQYRARRGCNRLLNVLANLSQLAWSVSNIDQD